VWIEAHFGRLSDVNAASADRDSKKVGAVNVRNKALGPMWYAEVEPCCTPIKVLVDTGSSAMAMARRSPHSIVLESK